MSMIGLCYKSGCLKHGEFQVNEAIQRKKAKLVIIAEDASENTKIKTRAVADKHKMNVLEYADKYTLGRIIGKEERSLLAVCDSGFADKIWLLYKEA